MDPARMDRAFSHQASAVLGAAHGLPRLQTSAESRRSSIECVE